jgi:tetratricopeptide (TPR) repeat protein
VKWVWVLLVSPALFAADERHLAMARDAQAAFNRVELAASTQLADASACVQSQAAMLSVALPAEEMDLHYRKGYCQLAVAAVTRAPSAFSDAAAELERAGSNMLAWIARRAGQLTDQPAWTRPDNCPASCQSLIPTANLWLGYLAFTRGDLETATQQFSARPDSGWVAYVAGLTAFHAGRYSDAVARYSEALDSWARAQQLANPYLALRLAPPADIPALLTELGGAQLLSGDAKGAVATLDRALQASTPAARAFFLRARAKELTGQAEPALSDYNLASRTAFAQSADLASGEAHLYRGILFYRRKDYTRAEEEFASALNLEISPILRPDASAWRHLSAVALGFCGASLQYLERALPSVSPYFPKSEAQALAASCLAGSPP